MKQDQMLARVIANNDQDREAGRKWMREATTADLFAVWNCIQRQHADPVVEVMSRFAQLAFAEMYVEVRGKEPH